MREQKRDATHDGDARQRGCDRAEDLVAHLYGEATPEETASFTRHLRACAVCREELSAFASVREMVAAERADVLGAAPVLDVNGLLAHHTGEVNAANEARANDSAEEAHTINAAAPLPSRPSTAARGRSAVAALREFFALSPLWLRAGAAACALLVCALAALTVARAEVRWDENGLALRTGFVEKRVEVPVQTGLTQEQVDALVAERLKDERAAMNRELQQARETAAAATAAAKEAKAMGNKSAQRLLVAGERPQTQQRRRVPQNNVRRDEQQLAEDDLPRLSDLLGGAY